MGQCMHCDNETWKCIQKEALIVCDCLAGKYYQVRSMFPGAGPCYAVYTATSTYFNRCFPTINATVIASLAKSGAALPSGAGDTFSSYYQVRPNVSLPFYCCAHTTLQACNRPSGAGDTFSSYYQVRRDISCPVRCCAHATVQACDQLSSALPSGAGNNFSSCNQARRNDVLLPLSPRALALPSFQAHCNAAHAAALLLSREHTNMQACRGLLYRQLQSYSPFVVSVANHISRFYAQGAGNKWSNYVGDISKGILIIVVGGLVGGIVISMVRTSSIKVTAFSRYKIGFSGGRGLGYPRHTGGRRAGRSAACCSALALPVTVRAVAFQPLALCMGGS